MYSLHMFMSWLYNLEKYNHEQELAAFKETTVWQVRAVAEPAESVWLELETYCNVEIHCGITAKPQDWKHIAISKYDCKACGARCWTTAQFCLERLDQLGACQQALKRYCMILNLCTSANNTAC